MTRGTPADADLTERRRLVVSMSDQLPDVPGVGLSETRLGGVPVLRCRPELVGDPVLLWFHGGAYRLGSAHSFRSWTSHLASVCAAEVVSVDYRIAPEHPFPDALVDAVLAYEAVRAEGRPIFVGGESAGGGLAAALLLLLADRGLPSPAGAILLSPWLDLRVAAASYTANAASDALFSESSAKAAADLYLNGHPATDPLVSPVLGEWSSQPPILVQASNAEVLRDDALLLARVAPSVQLEMFDGLPHAWHLGYPQADGSVPAVESVHRFIQHLTDSRQD